jgi:hypothetical protein
MMIDQIIAKAKGFIISPVESFQGARVDGTEAAAPYFIALLFFYAVLTAIITFVGINVMGMFTRYMPGFALPVVIFFCIMIGGAIATILFSLWLHLWVYIVGGHKGVLQTAKAVTYGMTPALLLGWIPFLGFIFCLWSILLQIIGIRELQEISSGRALLAVMIAVMVPLILLILIAMYLFISTVSTSVAPVPAVNTF